MFKSTCHGLCAVFIAASKVHNKGRGVGVSYPSECGMEAEGLQLLCVLIEESIPAGNKGQGVHII